jgi:hypothetical protein
MEEENAFENFRDLLSKFNGQLNLIDEQIDVDLQMEYFNLAAEIRKSADKDTFLARKEELFSLDDFDEIKHMLIILASVDNIEAFRILERFVQNNPVGLVRQWALLAYHESKMRIESSLLDENQVFVSTGLGGKNSKLRFFIVLFSANKYNPFNDFQQKIIRTELTDNSTRFEIELEDLGFSGRFSTITALIPVNHIIDDVFSGIINECNQYGSFIHKNYLITNVKKMTMDEVEKFAEEHSKDFEDNEE